MIDRAGHYEMLSRLVDGAQQIEIGADDSPYALNPWDVPDPAKVSREKVAFLFALHQVMMGGLDARQVGMIGAAIRAVYAKAASLPGSRPRESMLADELRAQAREAHDADAVDVAATLRNLADRLAEYCGEGTYAYLLDRETTVPFEAPLVVFDTRRCPESELRLVMFQVMEYVTATVERHWEAHKAAAGTPGAPLFLGRSIMLIDEAWHLINRPETGAYANNLARRARHLGLVLIVMCQQLSDFDTEHGVALVGRPAAAAGAEPEGDPVHRRHRAALRARGRRAATAQDGQGPPRADAVAQRHPRARQGRLTGRPDRVLGLHVRPDRGRDARGRDRRPPGQRVGRDRNAREARHPRAPRPPTQPGRRGGDMNGSRAHRGRSRRRAAPERLRG